MIDSLRAALKGGNWIGIVVALLLLIILRGLLSREERKLARTPLGLLLLHVVLLGIHAIPAEEGADWPKKVELFSFFFLLASIGRSSVLVVLQLVGRRLARPIPKIFGDLIQGGIYVAIGLLTLNYAGVDPASILTTSALLTAVIGLSLQDTLGNMFSGLAIQAQHPFDYGDWIRYGSDRLQVGQVVEMNWRAIKVQTLDKVEVTVPNAMLAKEPIINYSKPHPEVRRSVRLQATYSAPPRKVRKVILDSIREVPGVLSSPEPTVLTELYADSGIQYWVRYFIRDFVRREIIDAQVRDRIWYGFQRSGLSFPFPTRTLYMHEVSHESQQQDQAAQAQARARALECVDFVQALPERVRHELAERTRMRLYTTDEVIIREGDEGDELFIVDRGEASITLGEGTASQVEVARLGPGKFFGEMSVMTGERRKATVRAVTDMELLVIDKAAFQDILAGSPRLAETISQALADRETQLDKRISQVPEEQRKAANQERRNVLLDRIRDFFSL